jgi:hypothetical protein
MMVGDGPEKKRVLMSRARILDKVTFGNSNEIDKILSYTDLFLLPSKQKVSVLRH